jgi:hypothetical protein
LTVLVLGLAGLLLKPKLRDGEPIPPGTKLVVDGPAVIVQHSGGFHTIPLDPDPDRKTNDGRGVIVAGRRLLIDGKDYGLVESADKVVIDPTGAVTVNGAAREPGK